MSESTQEAVQSPLVEHLLGPDVSDSVLVYGPAMSGQRRLGFELLAADEDNSGQRIYVTTTERAVRARTALAATTTNSIGERTTIIDCLSDETNEQRTIAVGSPANLLAIADSVATLYREADRSERVGSRVLLDNLSTLLVHADLERVTRFLHPVIRHVEEHGGTVIATLDTDGTSDVERKTIRGLFDQEIAVRSRTDHGPEMSTSDSEPRVST